ncbi:MAG: PAS domain-containing sensor histidine kinase [Campylobacterota bacterium]|nr:PAS domain-containing sensor histidine kinase [Campylobacterota bacterium]
MPNNQSDSFHPEDNILNNYIDVTKTDLNGIITYASQMFCDTMGYTKEELVGKSHNIVKYELANTNIYKKLWEKISNDLPFTGTIQNKTKNSNIISFEILIEPDYDDNNNKIGYVAYRKNITTQKRLQEIIDIQVDKIREKDRQLNEQSKIIAMGEMIENIAHQWRQPLSLISTIASGMVLKIEHKIFNQEEALKNLTLLEETSQQLSHTIEDFRDFFKTDEIRKKFSLNKNCQKCASIVKASFDNYNIKIIKDEKDHFITIYGYEHELAQSVINILNNAKDALKDKENDCKFIFTTLHKEDENAVITIADSGGGIDDDIINNIFEPYFTTKHQSQGTGIGLYMTKEIIEKHFRGQISVKNKETLYKDNLFYGAEFKITLPLK